MKKSLLCGVWSFSIAFGMTAFARPQGQSVPAPADAKIANETPSQFYVRYRAAVQDASTMDQVMAFWRTATVTEFKEAPPDQRADLPAFKRMYGMFSDVKIAKEQITSTGHGATLTLQAKSPDGKTVFGTVDVVKEDGRWKLVGPESWQ